MRGDFASTVSRDVASTCTSKVRMSVILPCFNEEAALPVLFQRVTKAAEGWGVSWSAICVDDGSKDRTWELLREQCQKDPRWTAIRFSRNFGHQMAVSAGLYHSAEADVVAVMDADLQDPPEELSRFIEKWKEGYEVVYAVRQKRKEHIFRRVTYWIFYRGLAKVVTVPMPLDSGDFCLMDRKVVAALNAMPERSRFVRGLRAWSGFRQIGVPYERHARTRGESKYTFSKLLKLAADGVFNFSGLPLRLASHFGFWVSAIALAGVLFTLAQRLFKETFKRWGLEPVPGFATIVISILFLGGVQLICLGIVGEYLVRIFEEVKRRPLWIVAEACGVENRAPLL
jgi:polyisoprenyl-phosphate glycosyltransferase